MKRLAVIAGFVGVLLAYIGLYAVVMDRGTPEQKCMVQPNCQVLIVK